MPYYQALPSDLVPVHYDVAIRDIELDTYTGNVRLQLSVAAETDELHLHYRDLTIGAVSARVGEETVNAKVLRSEEKLEYFVIGFARPLRVDENVEVEVSFQGRIQTNMAGFYRSEYEENGQTKHMLSTQFEATDARRTFPCMDEPALKATFSVHLTVDKDLTVLGNMPEQETVQKGDVKTVTFERTPRMSTYLVAWAVGDFDYVESFTKDTYGGKPLPVRIYTTPGYTEDAQFAAELTPKIVDYFSQIFGLQYPLPKLDLLAVHAFSHNAMENWGLITYRSTALLFSEKSLDPAYKQNVAYVIAHELAHQWFGNLVTMQWWDELWLNEGFATWVGYAAVDFLFPEWDIFSGFVSSSMQHALALDGLRNSHAIKVPVVDALDIDQLFDAISYLKGAATIRMLSSYLSTDIFLQGVSKYLQTHQYGNATSEDLWAAIGDVANKPVGHMMEAWIKKIGFPVLSVSRSGETLQVAQRRFLNGGGVRPEENETVWWVPLHAQGDFGVDALEEKEVSVSATPERFFKLNGDAAGFFRVNYEPELLRKHVLPFFSKLLVKDKVSVVADVASLAISGDVATATFLDLVSAVAVEKDQLGDDYVVWLELCGRLSELASVFSGVDPALTKLITNFTRAVYKDLAVRKVKDEQSDFLARKLRSHILSHAAELEIEEVDAYAQELFGQWKKTGEMDPALRLFVFRSVVSADSVAEDDFERIWAEVARPPALDSREIALGALGHVKQPELASRLLQGLVDGSIPVMDAHFLGQPLSRNVSTRDMFWLFFRDNYTRLHELMSSNMVVLDRFVKVTLKNFQSDKMRSEIKAHFADKDIHGFERALAQVLDQVEINAAWYERDHQEVKEWLSSHGY